jgi:hypothetical protein
MDIDTQSQEVKEHTYGTVEEIESNDGSKCTKNKHFRKRILHLQEILLKTRRSRVVG